MSEQGMTLYQKLSLGIQASVAVVGIAASVFVGNALSEIREISTNVVRVVDGVQKLAEIDGEKVKQTAVQMGQAAGLLGADTAGAIGQVRGAITGHPAPTVPPAAAPKAPAQVQDIIPGPASEAAAGPAGIDEEAAIGGMSSQGATAAAKSLLDSVRDKIGKDD